MKRNCVLAVLAVVVIGSFAASAARAEQAYNLAWARQIGTTASDESLSVAVDGLGNAYISGATRGSLGGPNAGGYDAFLAKYTAVPEPGTVMMVLTALLGITTVARRKLKG